VPERAWASSCDLRQNAGRAGPAWWTGSIPTAGRRLPVQGTLGVAQAARLPAMCLLVTPSGRRAQARARIPGSDRPACISTGCALGRAARRADRATLNRDGQPRIEIDVPARGSAAPMMQKWGQARMGSGSNYWPQSADPSQSSNSSLTPFFHFFAAARYCSSSFNMEVDHEAESFLLHRIRFYCSSAQAASRHSRTHRR